jgi:protein TonB
VLAGTVLAAAAGGALAYYRPWEAGPPSAPALVTAADSAARDSLAADSARLAERTEADSLARARREDERVRAAVDSVRMADSLSREATRLAQQAADSAAAAGTAPGGGVAAGPSGEADAYDLVALDRRPQLRNLSEVTRLLSRNYPPLLRDNEIDGTVEVRFVVDAEGRPDMRTAQVVSASHPAFEEPTLRIARRMRFDPGRLGGRAVRTWVTFPIQWRTR